MSNRNLSGDSTPSNLGESLTRVSSVTSVLKRLFSKDDRTDGGTMSKDTAKTTGKMPSLGSTASLQTRPPGMSSCLTLSIALKRLDNKAT